MQKNKKKKRKDLRRYIMRKKMPRKKNGKEWLVDQWTDICQIKRKIKKSF